MAEGKNAILIGMSQWNSNDLAEQMETMGKLEGHEGETPLLGARGGCTCALQGAGVRAPAAGTRIFWKSHVSLWAPPLLESTVPARCALREPPRANVRGFLCRADALPMPVR